MSLPKVPYPVFELTLPISKEVVKFRPFLVKEQAILLTTLSSDAKFLVNNILNVIQNCCLSSINIDELSTIDMEYFFIQLRAKSVGEIIEKMYTCKNKVNDISCENKLYVDINLNDVNISSGDYNDMIMINDTLGLKMKFPNKETYEAEVDFDDMNLAKRLIISCIDYIFDDDQIYKMKDIPESEKYDFIDSLSLKTFNDIKTFFASLPKLSKTVEFNCSKCGYKHSIYFEGMNDFLA